MTPSSTRPPEPEANDDEDEHAAREFVEGVIARGEAATPVDGELPPGATHEIVEGDDDDDEGLTVRRQRFSAF